jgi:hypothetical protein
MRSERRHIRPVGQPSGDSGEFRLTKHWYDRPLSGKVKALGTLAGALTAIGSFSMGAGRFIRHQADEAIVTIIHRELAPVVAGQQRSDRLGSERDAALKVSIDLLTSEVQAVRAAVEKPKRKR